MTEILLKKVLADTSEKLVIATDVAGKAGALILTGPNGKLPKEFLEDGATGTTHNAVADEAIPANSFVQFYKLNGLNRVKLARPTFNDMANAFVAVAVPLGGVAVVNRGSYMPGLPAGFPETMPHGQVYLSHNAPGEVVKLNPQPSEPFFPFYLGGNQYLQRIGTTTEAGVVIHYEELFGF